jgi:hypothetical protein
MRSRPSARPARFLASAALLAVLAASAGARAQTPPPTKDQLDFFEQKIRPILSDNCYKCHSEGAEKIKGGLLLDSRGGALKGGDTSPAVVPGHPEKSLLVRAINYTDKDLQMPPNERKLSDSQIADFTQWIKMGAPDPRESGTGKEHRYQVDLKEAKKHWSYQPVQDAPPPRVDDPRRWVQTPVDNFILEKLGAKELSPSPRADKVTLLRRATFDLTGLPPAPGEVQAFVADDSPEAFAKVVDRLLASPRYGERWGRYWLDLAQYADTKGQEGGGRDPRYIYAYTYRDWVIQAFNTDLPYDQFLIDQIAADKLPQGGDKRTLAAMGFLTLGNRFNDQPNDIIDNRIDITCKSTMAMTAVCARCHDHKFDPIPTKDYYSLFGVFSSSIEPKEGPIIAEPGNPAAYREFQAELARREAAYDNLRDKAVLKIETELKEKAGAYMMAVHDFQKASGGQALPPFMQKRGLYPQIAQLWRQEMGRWQNRQPRVFKPWLEFAALDDADFAVKAKEISARYYSNGEPAKGANPVVARLWATPPASLSQVAGKYASLFIDVDQRWQQELAAAKMKTPAAGSTNAAPAAMSDPDREEVRRLVFTQGSPIYLDDRRVEGLLNRDNMTRNKLNNLQRAVLDLKQSHPGSPARANILEDAPRPADAPVLIHGNSGSRGPLAPREFLWIIAGDERKPFRDGSGRLELARAIASPDNPLTARVMVNRIWLHHFGEGLVRTPDDFGMRSDPPTHPELLDYLAARFVEGGWSVKKMHRLIMLSSVYQQGSGENPRYAQIDPDNRYYWTMNRRRLDFEAFRDTLLAIGGKLDLTVGGPPVELNAEPYSLRRSIYGYVDRNNLPNMFVAFDFASPDLTTGLREDTVVPQQALFMMNSPLVVEQAQDLVRRPGFKARTTAEERIKFLYNLIYQRAPGEVEIKVAKSYLESNRDEGGSDPPAAAWEYGYGEYDPVARRVREFMPMTVFADGAWHPDPKLNDRKANGARLSAEGGFPGQVYAVIRRWVAPRDGVVSITGALTHQGQAGDGVMARIVSSRTGELGRYLGFKSTVETKLARVVVKRGDAIDFETDRRANPRDDQFTWMPVIHLTTPEGAEAGTWGAQKDFTGAPSMKHLSAWEKYAQVLLESNETAFVN